MKKCWYRLNIDISKAISNDWKFPIPNGIDDRQIWPIAREEIFSEEWLETMEKIGIPIAIGILFYRRPCLIDDFAHIDLAGDPAEIVNCGFNWVISGEAGEMIWYDKPQQSGAFVPVNSDGERYLSWPISQLQEIDRCVMEKNQLILIRVDHPHAMINRSSYRWTISARSPVHLTTWDKMVNDYQHLLER
jgi:hypothetical protein